MASGNVNLMDQLKSACSFAETNVSEKVNKLTDLMSACENIDTLKEVRSKLKHVLEEFQAAHEAYHKLIKTGKEQEESLHYYNSVLETVSEN